jgi:hypothetical protein
VTIGDDVLQHKLFFYFFLNYFSAAIAFAMPSFSLAESMPSFSPAFAVPRFDGIVLHTHKTNRDVLCYMDGEAVGGLVGDVTQYIGM